MAKYRNNVVCNVAGHLIFEVPCTRNRVVRRYMERSFADMSCVFYPNTCLAFEDPADAERMLEYTQEADALAFVHSYAATLKRK